MFAIFVSGQWLVVSCFQQTTNNGRALKSIMRKRLVRVSHSVNVVSLFDGVAAIICRVEQFAD